MRVPQSIKGIIRRKLIDSGLIGKAVIEVNGKTIVFHEVVKSSILKDLAYHQDQSYEMEVASLVTNFPYPIEYFVDCGANVGYFSALAELSFPKATQVIAVEPFPDNVAYLKRLREENHLSFEIVERALAADKDREVDFYFPVHKSSSALSSSASLIDCFRGSGKLYDHLPAKNVKVITTTLSSVLQNPDNPALIKLDCEGAELDILTSSPKHVNSNSIDWIIEILINDEDKAELFELMRSSGYDAYLITNGGLVKEDRPLTLPYLDRPNRTCWKNHFFTKKDPELIKIFSKEVYHRWI